MSDMTAPIGAEPADTPPPQRGGWPTSAKVLLGVLLALVLVGAGAGAVVLAGSSNDDSKTVAAKHSKSSTTSSSTTTTTTTGAGSSATTTPNAGGGSGSGNSGGGGSGSATTPTAAQGGAGPGTKLAAPTKQAAIPSVDEPTFTSASAPSSVHCSNGDPGTFAQFIVSWATTNATSVTISLSAGGGFPGQPASGSKTVGFSCDHTGSLVVQFMASGPGGNGLATKTVTITH